MRLTIVVDVPDETRGEATEVAEYLLDPCADDPVAALVSATWGSTDYCAWCEEAGAPAYLAHEGHDPECPFDSEAPPLT